jgi:uncharacterized protein YegL
MSFSNPGAWIWASLALVIILLYLWRFSPAPHTTATYLLWQRALERRPAWFSLRFWLSLAAQLVLLVLLVAALADPFWTSVARSRRTIVLVADVSASMSAPDTAPTRFEAMRSEARRIAGDLQPGEQMAIVTAGSTVATACRFTDRPDLLLEAIDALAATDGTTSVPQAVELARRMLNEKPNPHLVVLTDGALPDAAELAAADNVQVTVLGGGAANAGITALAAQPQVADPRIFDILVEVRNFAEEALACDLHVGLQGETEQTAPLRIDPGDVQQILLPIAVPQDGLLQARLTTDDDLPADDRGRLLVQHRLRPQVLLITDGSTSADRQLQDILESDPRWDVSAHSELPAALPDKPVVLFHRRLPDRLPSCPMLVIDPRQPSELWQLGGTIDGAQAAASQVSAMSPLLNRVRFRDFVVEQAVQLTFQEPAVALVTSHAGTPLYSLIRRPHADVLVLHVNLQREKSDLTMRPDFPILIKNAVAWLSRDERPVSVAATTAASVSVPPSDQPWQLKSTEDGEIQLQMQPQQTVAALDRVGVWTAAGGSQDVTLPVNLLSRAESDVRPASELSSRQFEAPATDPQPLWMLLVACALLGLAVEWCLYQWRIVV